MTAALDMKLKIDLHIHSLEYKQTRSNEHPALEIIDTAHKEGFDVISITDHNEVTYNQNLIDYAASKDILLIPGTEANINKKHVLLYNFDFNRYRIKTFKDIEKLKSSDNLCLAPHPFYPGSTSLNGDFELNSNVFDGLEFCHFYSKQINFNKKALSCAQKYNLPIIAMSDSHFPFQLGINYSFIDAEKNIHSVIRAIKEGNVEVVSRPLGILQMSSISLKLIGDNMLAKFR